MPPVVLNFTLAKEKVFQAAVDKAILILCTHTAVTMHIKHLEEQLVKYHTIEPNATTLTAQQVAYKKTEEVAAQATKAARKLAAQEKKIVAEAAKEKKGADKLEKQAAAVAKKEATAAAARVAATTEKAANHGWGHGHGPSQNYG
ncbi:hypothetical protein BDZ91DRAFT_796887 [Kalaharituber pfeilii]|nr:hypothetical protein BDZ91DRAFT_796887 [Kalaharituber pfeilii]